MMTLEDCRQFYAEGIRAAVNPRTQGLVEAFARVPREQFMGDPPWHIGSKPPRSGQHSGESNDPRQLYHDVLVALDASRGLNNGQPSALAHWMDALHLKRGDRVFHLGCGTGYYTAIMAEVVGSEGAVLAAEVEPELAERAKQNLAGYRSVTVVEGDGAALDPGDLRRHVHQCWSYASAAAVAQAD